MGLLERIDARRKGQERAWPVGKGSLVGGEEVWGHDNDQFSPEEYGDYIATSNDVYSVINKRARLMSGLTLNVFNGRGADKLEAPDSPASKLLRYVNPYWTYPRLARMDEMSMGLWGETYWAIEKRRGQPAEIWWLKPSRVKPVPSEQGYLKGYLYYPANGGEPIPFRTDEIIWYRYPNPLDEFSALSPMGAARLAADTGAAMMRSNEKLFSQGLQMGGMITPTGDKVTFSADQAKELERSIDRRFKGVDKAHKWGVLRFEAQFKQMGITPKDAEFVNGLNLTLRRVCNAYGMQSALLNDFEHATLANATIFERVEWSGALKPDADFRAAEITEQFLPMFRGGPDYCEFDFTGVPALQESASESWARERQAIEVGALTINEWRKSKGLPSVPWGDVYWAPVNKSAVEDADSAPQGDTAPAGTPPPPSPDDERALLAALNGRAWSLR